MAPVAPRDGTGFAKGLLLFGGLAIAAGVLLLLLALVVGAIGWMLGPLVALVGVVLLAMGGVARRGPGTA